MSTEPVTDDAGVAPVSDEYVEGSPAPSRRMEILVPLVALVIMSAFLALSFGLELRREPGPGQIDARFWPILLSTAGVALAVWRLILVLVVPAPDRDELDLIQRGGYRRLAITLGLSIVYITFWSFHSVILFGFRINLFVYITTLFLAALVYVYGFRDWKTSWKAVVIFPIITSVGIYVLFGVLLRIPL